jgi:hypothetical protein
MPGFIAYPQGPSRVRRIRGRDRHRILQMMEERQAAIGYCPSTDIDPRLRTEITISESLMSAKEARGEPLKRKKTTDDLVYLGRLPACKKLKIWVRAVNLSGYIHEFVQYEYEYFKGQLSGLYCRGAPFTLFFPAIFLDHPSVNLVNI